MKKILLVWLSLFAPAVFGWGAEGHRITALMAEEMLSPRARIAVNQLLDGGTLTDAALYMDVYGRRSNVKYPARNAGISTTYRFAVNSPV